ncbi:gamma-glutamyltransferase family protein [Streptomyces iconiensis]|uniref:Gamma-glutamyltransferase n=1 Tax=Streptomyces iconiensis TaxID=1384038 RepID=A0ABT6ZTT7_9ACTN|nr:gamma-glutamyltransferase [Streptomyces iconiensis]MDJ1132464.1 gamma-glutamyltransferase [Streptomyces iconiensis]
MFTTRPTLHGTFGMVSSTHWLASQSGMAVLENGGNAYDAAVSAGFVLHVVEPHLNGPAGEVPVLVAPADGEVRVLCGQGVAPAGATVAHYRSLGLSLIPGTGPLAAAVPGAFDAWMVLLRDYGTMPLSDVLKYAIDYAENGHPVMARVGDTVETVRGLYESEWTSSADIYLPDGASPRAGELFRNRALAATWRRLIAEATSAAGGADGCRTAQIEAARRVWREGFIAHALVAQAGRPTLDSSGERHTGTLSLADLAAWEATYERPATYDWNGWTLCKAGGWSQGPTLLQQLALLPPELPAYGSAEYVHLLIEGSKLAMADREAWYGDALAEGVPLDALLSDSYNAGRRALLTGEASYALRPGRPGGREPRLPSHVRAVAEVPRPCAPGLPAGIGEPTVAPDGTTRGDTCHLAAVDRWGNMVSATPSGGWLQSNPVVPELGFPLGTRLQMAWLEEGLANSLTPGRRPRTTLTPSVALRNGVPFLAFGSPGGDSQDQWQTHFFLTVALNAPARGPLDLQAAIDAPNWHQESFPSSFYPRATRPGSVTIESRMDEAVLQDLRQRGHDITLADAWSEGRLSAVARDPETGVLSAGANPRGMQGYATGR